MLKVSSPRNLTTLTQFVQLTEHAGSAARDPPPDDDAEKAAAAKVAMTHICRNITTALRYHFLGRDDASWGDDGIQKDLTIIRKWARQRNVSATPRVLFP